MCFTSKEVFDGVAFAFNVGTSEPDFLARAAR
jgi:hypothetical protein